MKSDQELREKFRIFVDKDNIINLIFLEEETDSRDSARLAELVKKAVLEILNKNPRESYSGFVDISSLAKKVSYLSKDIRRIYAEVMSHKQLKKIAIFGLNLFYTVATKFIIQAAGKEQSVKLFANKKEAFKWLKRRK